MTRLRDQIAWCWPEALEANATLRRQLEALGDLTVDINLPADGRSVDVLVPRLTHIVSDAVIDRLPGLRVIATPSTGTDHIDLTAARRRGIAVISLRQDPSFLRGIQSTAELAWLLILACARRAPAAFAQAKTGQWRADAVRGNELLGKTLGVVGVGRLGTMVARFGRAFGMNVLGTDPNPVATDGVTFVDLSTLLSAADVISLHVHLDDTTRRLIGRRELAAMRPGTILVNTSRGAVIDEDALLEALQRGHLTAGLDVLDGERNNDFARHPLIEYAATNENLILTPHVGGCTVEAQAKAFGRLAEQIVDHLNRTAVQQS